MSNKQVRVGVVFGGRSSEHEVSLASAANVIAALEEAGYSVAPIGITPQGRWLTGGDPLRRLSDNAAANAALAHANGIHAHMPDAEDSWALLPSAAREERLPAIDVIFPVLHGPYGEDGTIQGLLEMANLPYVGCGVLSSAVAMDKAVTKRLFAVEGLPQVRYRVLSRAAWQRDPEAVCDEVEEHLEYPLFVKPANLGSSVGISKAPARPALVEAVTLAAEYDRRIVVEEAVPHAREIEVSVLGNDAPIASIPGEIVPGREFYDYAAKYLEDSSQLLIPAPLSREQTEAVRAMAVRAFRAVDGSGLARVDFLLDGASGALYVNEINTLPGFTRISMYPKLWEATGIPYPDLVDRLVQLAQERYADRQQNRTDR
jgi:D-alanine-D-alanine ligase